MWGEKIFQRTWISCHRLSDHKWLRFLETMESGKKKKLQVILVNGKRKHTGIQVFALPT